MVHRQRAAVDAVNDVHDVVGDGVAFVFLGFLPVHFRDHSPQRRKDRKEKTSQIKLLNRFALFISLCVLCVFAVEKLFQLWYQFTGSLARIASRSIHHSSCTSTSTTLRSRGRNFAGSSSSSFLNH